MGAAAGCELFQEIAFKAGSLESSVVLNSENYLSGANPMIHCVEVGWGELGWKTGEGSCLLISHAAQNGPQY